MEGATSCASGTRYGVVRKPQLTRAVASGACAAQPVAPEQRRCSLIATRAHARRDRTARNGTCPELRSAPRRLRVHSRARSERPLQGAAARGARHPAAMDGPDEAPKQEAPADVAAAGGDAAEAAEEPQQHEPAAEAAEAVKEEHGGEQLDALPPATTGLEPASGGMVLGGDDGGLVGASGQRISAAEIQLVQNLVERCLQARCSGHAPCHDGQRRLQRNSGATAARAAHFGAAAARAARTQGGGTLGEARAAAGPPRWRADTRDALMPRAPRNCRASARRDAPNPRACRAAACHVARTPALGAHLPVLTRLLCPWR